MNTALKLSAYGAALALLIAGGWATGSAVGPLTTGTTADAAAHGATSGAEGAGHGDTHSGTVAGATGAEPARPADDAAAEPAQPADDAAAEPAQPADDAADQPGGLASSRGGYTLTPTAPTLTPGTTETFAFTITGRDGAPVTDFAVEHDKRMHLIVVRRDTTGFQHIHPEMAPDGTWSVPLTLPAGGSYRAFADFTPAGGAGTTLGVDLAASGAFEPVSHIPTATATDRGEGIRR
jgi:hypothetical protein